MQNTNPFFRFVVTKVVLLKLKIVFFHIYHRIVFRSSSYNRLNLFYTFLFAAFHDLLLPPLRATVRAAAGPTAAGDHPEAATPTPAPAPATPTPTPTAAAAPAPAGRGGRTGGRSVVGGRRR